MEAKAHLKRIESAPWADDELAVRDGMLAVLRTDEPPPAAAAAAASGAADDPTSLIGGLDATMMLQTIRGYYYEEPRTENTLAAYHRILSWRAEQGADTVLSDPPAEVVAEHAAWREIWFMDIYGMNS
jgi:Ser/Thr protein kinase RdoA (MazF antagonist)